MAIPVFKGFEAARYQEHDALIVALVAAFNRDKAGAIGATPAQAAKIPDLSEAYVKSMIIQESGGGGSGSLAAWKADPAQVNVPGDWSEYKASLGLTKPVHRNEGSVEVNLKAAIRWLARKGFGTSGQPPANRPDGFFDGWKMAIQRYNGRTDSKPDGRTYAEHYAQRIVERAENPDTHYKIEL